MNYLLWSKKANYNFNNFIMIMMNKLILNTVKKGEPVQSNLLECSNEYLLNKLEEHLELGHYEDVANFAFLLRVKEGSFER